MRIVVPFGFYGWGNIGDEATLQGFARLLSGYRLKSRVWVASRDPSHTARIEPSLGYYDVRTRNARSWWTRRRAALYAFAGGTPIMDILGSYPLGDVIPLVDWAWERDKRIVFLGIGTETLHREESRIAVAEKLAPRVDGWSVRSERDRDRLAQYGVNAASITVAADMAWLLDSVSPTWGQAYLRTLGVDAQRPLIGINVNAERFMAEQAPDLWDRVGSFLDELVAENEVTPVFLCNDASEGASYDKAASERVRASMKHADRTVVVPNQYWSPQQMLSLIACCRATVSTRYHFCLFSALQAVPFIALQRSDKVADLCLDLGWPYAVPIRTIEPSALLDLQQQIEREESLATRLKQASIEMRQRAVRSRAVLDPLLASGGTRR
jgi:polysaccharide pyruvyl transferase WcaK-like protein